METAIQQQVVNQLARKGFRVTNTIAGYEPETIAVLMSKRPTRYTILMAEVEADGTVNGQTATDFLQRLNS